MIPGHYGIVHTLSGSGIFLRPPDGPRRLRLGFQRCYERLAAVGVSLDFSGALEALGSTISAKSSDF